MPSVLDELKKEPPHIPDKYVWLRKLGCSNQYAVSLCLPRSAVGDIRSRLVTGDEDAITDALLKEVVILKINAYDSGAPPESIANYRERMNKEIRTLQKIKGETYARSGGKQCAQILDHYDMDTTDEGEWGWLTMQAAPLSCDLDTISLFDSRTKLPEALLWLVITQMYDILWFLQHGCNPSIAHQDLDGSSIVISFPDEQGQNSESAAAKRPKATLVGFGRSVIQDNSEPENNHILSGDEALMGDVTDLVQEICNLVKRCYDYGISIRGTGKIIRRSVVILDEDVPKEVDAFFAKGEHYVNSLEESWAEIGEFAKEQLEKVGDEEWDELRDLVLEIVKSERSLRDIVKDALKGHPAGD